MTSLNELRAHPQIVKLTQALHSRAPTELHDHASRRAAVAILIRPGARGEPELFFIKRAVYAGDPWSGQIAFPGGREEPGDTDLFHTAARETFEETTIDIRNGGHLLGALDDLRPSTVRLPDVIVRPFVVLLPNAREPHLSHEVADSFSVPFGALLDRSVWRDTTVRAAGVEMSRFAFHHQGYVVWGMTERILSSFLDLLL